MVKLTIRYADGTIYWVMYFNTRTECDIWLTAEQTRPYWGNSKDGKGKEAWSFQIIDNTPTPKTQAEIDAEKALELQRQTLFQEALAEVSSLDETKLSLTASELQTLAKALIKYFKNNR